MFVHYVLMFFFSNTMLSDMSNVCYVFFLVTEWGDDVRPMSEDEAMVIVNHQSTGDVCTLMMCLQDKGTVSTPLLGLGPVLLSWL